MTAAAATDASGGSDGADGAGSQRLDKWLWFVRVIKSRTQAAGLVTEGKVRVNREKVTKPSQSVRTGDVVTITVRGHVRVLRMVGAGARRGPPAEAQSLYEDLTPVVAKQAAVDQPAINGERLQGTGRPTKKERREMDRMRRGD